MNKSRARFRPSLTCFNFYHFMYVNGCRYKRLLINELSGGDIMKFRRVQLVLLVSGLILLSLAQPSAAVEHAFWISGGEGDDCSSFSLGFAWQCYALEVGFINDV